MKSNEMLTHGPKNQNMKSKPNIRTATALAVACSVLSCLTGCTDAEKSAISALGKKHRITLYGNSGTPIRTWTTTGAITDVKGDGCYFRDEETGVLVEIRGTMIIEVIK